MASGAGIVIRSRGDTGSPRAWVGSTSRSRVRRARWACRGRAGRCPADLRLSPDQRIVRTEYPLRSVRVSRWHADGCRDRRSGARQTMAAGRRSLTYMRLTLVNGGDGNDAICGGVRVVHTQLALPDHLAVRIRFADSSEVEKGNPAVSVRQGLDPSNKPRPQRTTMALLPAHPPPLLP